jgi:signal recognition particle receptor subunit beta
MSFVNSNAKEVHCKIVYYGPSLGGKTTNIQWVYQQTAHENKSKMHSYDKEVERTLFFDFLPLNIGDIRGYKTRFHLYTVPGQIVYDASRKLILKGLDGVIFVADSQEERMEENIQALKNLERNLEQQNYDIRQVPLVIQYNKRDLSNAMKLHDMKSTLNIYNAPDFEAIAHEGKGVLESLKTVSKSIVGVLKGGNLTA